MTVASYRLASERANCKPINSAILNVRVLWRSPLIILLEDEPNPANLP